MYDPGIAKICMILRTLVTAITLLCYIYFLVITEMTEIINYRVSLKKGTFLVHSVSKKRYFLGFCLILLLEVRFYFFTCVSESEFRARFI